MPGFEPWDVVRVPFPCTDRPVRQHRPALVVAVPAIAGGSDLLWVLMVTSVANRGWPGDVPVADLQAAGLPVASVVRVAKIATIEAAIATRLGALTPADRAAVAASFHAQLPPFEPGAPRPTVAAR